MSLTITACNSLTFFFRFILFVYYRRKYGITLPLVVLMLASHDVFVIAPAMTNRNLRQRPTAGDKQLKPRSQTIWDNGRRVLLCKEGAKKAGAGWLWLTGVVCWSKCSRGNAMRLTAAGRHIDKNYLLGAMSNWLLVFGWGEVGKLDWASWLRADAFSETCFRFISFPFSLPFLFWHWLCLVRWKLTYDIS